MATIQRTVKTEAVLYTKYTVNIDLHESMSSIRSCLEEIPARAKLRGTALVGDNLLMLTFTLDVM